MKKIITILVMLTSMQSQGVHLSEDGTGQVLIFPYYTVNAGFNSLLTITNTTQRAKALRVRFREAANSREVFTFNLYLGANDVWVAGLIKSDDSTVELITPDNSCTVPNLHNQQNFFSKSHFTNDMLDAYGDNDNRLFEGFIEVIEMGELTGNSELAATFVETGIQPPYNCSDLVNAWDVNHADNYWVLDATTDLLPPRGGISGDLTLISVLDGIAMNAKPTVIENFSYEILHDSIESDSPSLADGMTDSTIINSEDWFALDTSWDTGIQALSSILMVENIKNEYNVNADFGAETTWIVTMPTKQYFTDSLYTNEAVPQMPFVIQDTPESSCVLAGVSELFNRSSESPPVTPGQIIGIPPPPTEKDAIPYLCNTVNTISFNYDTYNTNTITGIFDGTFPIKNYYGHHKYTGLNIPYHEGVANFNFGHNKLTDSTGVQLSGLPVIAFSAQKYINGSLDNGTLANYGTISKHKSISSYVDSTHKKFGMQLKKNGKGQALVYPYYTVKNEFNTLFSIVNGYSDILAVRVRFREGKNARDVLDFNLYLSPFDVWTAALISTESTVEGHVGEPSVKLVTNDESCIVPLSISQVGQEFLPSGYEVQYDGKGHSLERVQEGFFEVIEMGLLTGEEYNYLSENGGFTSGSCERFEQNWLDGGKWELNPNEDIEQQSGYGSLYGTLQLINVNQGIDMNFDAIAISAYSTQSQHNPPGTQTPNFRSGNNNKTLIEYDGNILNTTWDTPLDAVSALFMHDTTSNQYDINPSVGAQTDWVIMSPTRHYYTDKIYDANNPKSPYGSGLTPNETDFCQRFGFESYNREQVLNTVSGPIPSPNPPGNYDQKHCYSINVSFADNNPTFTTPESQSIFNSQLLIEDWIVFNGTAPIYHMAAEEGVLFMNLDDGDRLQGQNIPNSQSHTIYGKPIISFTAQKYVNGKLAGGVLANYAIIKPDTTTRKIEVVAPAQ